MFSVPLFILPLLYIAFLVVFVIFIIIDLIHLQQTASLTPVSASMTFCVLICTLIIIIGTIILSRGIDWSQPLVEFSTNAFRQSL